MLSQLSFFEAAIKSARSSKTEQAVKTRNALGSDAL
jgi:hypothetical protein